MAKAKNPFQEYFNEYSRCPKCGAKDIEAGPHEYENDQVWTLVTCNACGFRWNDVYVLHHITDEDGKILAFREAVKPCKKCGCKDSRVYGFCQDCWNELHLGTQEVFGKWRKALDEGPHDASEEEMIFDDLVQNLWTFFKGRK